MWFHCLVFDGSPCFEPLIILNGVKGKQTIITSWILKMRQNLLIDLILTFQNLTKAINPITRAKNRFQVASDDNIDTEKSNQ